MKSRIFNIEQSAKHLTADKIEEAITSHKTIKRSAYILHDQDTYSESDQENWQRIAEKIKAENEKIKEPEAIKENWAEKKLEQIKAGEIIIGETIKAPHFHVVIECSQLLDTDVISRWFGIKSNYVECPKGKGAFLDCVKYLTHEGHDQRAAGKHLYADNLVHADFNFRDELDQARKREDRYGKKLNTKEFLRNSVLYDGMTLKQVQAQYPAEYTEDMAYLKKCRLDYISTVAPMPVTRVNFYITGQSGYGKSLVSRGLARSIVSRNQEIPDDEVFFIVGSGQTTFEGYDGQPVIIWDDCRAFTLLEKLGGRENVFNVFDLFPVDVKQNIKYGSIRLINSINIVNSVQGWEEFLDALCGEYKDKKGNIFKVEDKTQSYRRFPFFIVVHAADYDIGYNKGIFNGDNNFLDFEQYHGLRGSMRRIAKRCGNNLKLRDRINARMLKPAVKKFDELQQNLVHEQEATDEEILAEFADVGTIADVEVEETELKQEE